MSSNDAVTLEKAAACTDIEAKVASQTRIREDKLNILPADDVDFKNTTADDDRINNIVDVRVAVVGNVDSGKSTLTGVLTSGILDDGRGLARSRVFVHAHELANGRTSCISHHIMGFD